jgi:hypothetical protein
VEEHARSCYYKFGYGACPLQQRVFCTARMRRLSRHPSRSQATQPGIDTRWSRTLCSGWTAQSMALVGIVRDKMPLAHEKPETILTAGGPWMTVANAMRRIAGPVDLIKVKSLTIHSRSITMSIIMLNRARLCVFMLYTILETKSRCLRETATHRYTTKKIHKSLCRITSTKVHSEPVNVPCSIQFAATLRPRHHHSSHTLSRQLLHDSC